MIWHLFLNKNIPSLYLAYYSHIAQTIQTRLSKETAVPPRWGGETRKFGTKVSNLKRVKYQLLNIKLIRMKSPPYEYHGTDISSVNPSLRRAKFSCKHFSSLQLCFCFLQFSFIRHETDFELNPFEQACTRESLVIYFRVFLPVRALAY